MIEKMVLEHNNRGKAELKPLPEEPPQRGERLMRRSPPYRPGLLQCKYSLFQPRLSSQSYATVSASA